MLRSQVDAMAVNWSDLWVLFTPHDCRVHGPMKFAGSLDFWVGPSLQIPKKTSISLQVCFFFGWVHPFKIPRKLQKSPSFKIFGWARPLKSQETAEKFEFRDFLGVGPPLKNCGKPWKNPNVETCSLQENRRKIQISKPVPRALPKNCQLVNPHIFLLFLLTSASK